MKYKLIRLILRLATIFMKIYKPEMAPIKTPKRFVLVHRSPTGTALKALIKAYQTVFKEAKYWAETWCEEAVQAKIKREVCDRNCFLVTMKGNDEFPVAGFAWGKILHPTGLKYRVAKTLEKPLGELNGLTNALFARRVKELVYADEFAIVNRPGFIGGIEPIKGLLQPWLEWAWFKNHTYSCLFWTTPKSPIYKLGLYMGWEPIFQIKDGNKNIVFIFNPDFRPLLKICQNLDTRKIARLMTVAEKVLSHKKKTK